MQSDWFEIAESVRFDFLYELLHIFCFFGNWVAPLQFLNRIQQCWVIEQTASQIRLEHGQQLRLLVQIFLYELSQIEHTPIFDPINLVKLLQYLFSFFILCNHLLVVRTLLYGQVCLEWLVDSQVLLLRSETLIEWLVLHLHILNRYGLSQLHLLLGSILGAGQGALSAHNVLAEFHELIGAVLLNIIKVHPRNPDDGGELSELLSHPLVFAEHLVLDGSANIYLVSHKVSSSLAFDPLFFLGLFDLVFGILSDLAGLNCEVSFHLV